MSSSFSLPPLPFIFLLILERKCIKERTHWKGSVSVNALLANEIRWRRIFLLLQPLPHPPAPQQCWDNCFCSKTPHPWEKMASVLKNKTHVICGGPWLVQISSAIQFTVQLSKRAQLWEQWTAAPGQEFFYPPNSVSHSLLFHCVAVLFTVLFLVTSQKRPCEEFYSLFCWPKSKLLRSHLFSLMSWLHSPTISLASTQLIQENDTVANNTSNVTFSA